jgi:isocitrate/isopropylmalate dehydrogenase
MMLRHLKLATFADRLESALFGTLAEGVKTKDIGGTASTTAFLDAICRKIDAECSAKKTAKKGKGVSKAV